MSAFTNAIERSASPRLYRRYQRHARVARLRYSAQAREFLRQQAVRLASVGYESSLFAALTANTAGQIAAAANIGELN